MYLVNAILKLKKNTFLLHLLEFLHKKSVKWDKTKLWQNTVCLEHQIYTSQKKITQPLDVMVETFWMSGLVDVRLAQQVFNQISMAARAMFTLLLYLISFLAQ